MTVPASLAVAELPPGVTVSHVYPGSPAERAGLRLGEKITHINDAPVRDTVDFYFHGGGEEDLALQVEDAKGVVRNLRITKDIDQHLGVEVEQFTTQHCGCNCVFCFVHQLPDNMRKSLYVKDEDYRLSFMQGSYITGTTLKDSDLERIARQRLTPLQIPVHAVDEELRLSAPRPQEGPPHPRGPRLLRRAPHPDALADRPLPREERRRPARPDPRHPPRPSPHRAEHRHRSPRPHQVARRPAGAPPPRHPRIRPRVHQVDEATP